MSSFFDMISAFIAMLMSAAFLHFGAAGESHPVTPAPTASHTVASSADPIVDENDMSMPAKPSHAPVRHLAAQCHRHDATGVAPMVDTVRAPSPLRRG